MKGVKVHFSGDESDKVELFSFFKYLNSCVLIVLTFSPV